MFHFVFPCNGFGVRKMTFNMLAEARDSSDGHETVPKAGRAPSSWGGPIMIDQFPSYPWLATFYRK